MRTPVQSRPRLGLVPRPTARHRSAHTHPAHRPAQELMAGDQEGTPAWDPGRILAAPRAGTQARNPPRPTPAPTRVAATLPSLTSPRTQENGEAAPAGSQAPSGSAGRALCQKPSGPSGGHTVQPTHQRLERQRASTNTRRSRAAYVKTVSVWGGLKRMTQKTADPHRLLPRKTD